MNTPSIHFIFCMERTGSTMLTAMLNKNPHILSPSEVPFYYYLYKKYKNKSNWVFADFLKLDEEFRLFAGKKIIIFYPPVKESVENLNSLKSNSAFHEVFTKLYLNFFPNRNKEKVKIIVDKQILYNPIAEKIASILPHSKFILLTRDCKSVVASWKKRKLSWNLSAGYLAMKWKLNYDDMIRFSGINAIRIHWVKYENIILHKENELKKISDFLNCRFDPDMLSHSENIKEYLFNSESNDEKYIKYFEEFHSNTLKESNPDVIEEWKNILTANDLYTINFITRTTSNKLGYSPFESGGNMRFSDKIGAMLAVLEYRFLRISYLQLPLSIKIGIKKIRLKFLFMFY